MPTAALRPCSHAGCRALVAQGTCEVHTVDRWQGTDRKRPHAYARGYDRRWQAARAAFLARCPLCAHCQARATVVDHVIPHKGNQGLFWDSGNWQPLCRYHHEIKGQRERGAPCPGHVPHVVAEGTVACSRCGQVSTSRQGVEVHA